MFSHFVVSILSITIISLVMQSVVNSKHSKNKLLSLRNLDTQDPCKNYRDCLNCTINNDHSFSNICSWQSGTCKSTNY